MMTAGQRVVFLTAKRQEEFLYHRVFFLLFLDKSLSWTTMLHDVLDHRCHYRLIYPHDGEDIDAIKYPNETDGEPTNLKYDIGEMENERSFGE